MVQTSAITLSQALTALVAMAVFGIRTPRI
jgi:hypothetical protein